jgi:hypothetical protein
MRFNPNSLGFHQIEAGGDQALGVVKAGGWLFTDLFPF